MLVVTKLDKKGATNRFHELRQKLQSMEHGKSLLSSTMIIMMTLMMTMVAVNYALVIMVLSLSSE